MRQAGNLRKLRHHSRFADQAKRKFAAWCVFVMLFSSLDLASFRIYSADADVDNSSIIISDTIQNNPILLSQGDLIPEEDEFERENPDLTEQDDARIEIIEKAADGELTEETEEPDEESGETEKAIDGELAEEAVQPDEEPGETEKAADGELAEEAEEPDEEPGETEGETPFELSAETDGITVTLSYAADAAIPENTEIVIADAGSPQPRKMGKKLNAVPAKSAMNQPTTAEYPAADISLTTWSTGEEAPEIQLYHRALDIGLFSDGEEVEPESEVTVTITLPDLEEGLQVAVKHQTESGLIELPSTTEGQTVIFTTDGFSIFDFSSTAQKLVSWTTDLLENTILGGNQNAAVEHSAVQVDESTVPEGISILEAFSVTRSSNLWMMIQRLTDLALGKLESISLYAVEDGELAAVVKENISLSDILRLSLENYSSFALVRDSGLRRKTADVGVVRLNGLMPKDSEASVDNVTEQYADYLPGTVRSTGNKNANEAADTGAAGDSTDETGAAGAAEITNSEETESNRNTQRKKQITREIVAAYDIAIISNGEEYQPDEAHPVQVTIEDEGIQMDNQYELWHITDGGTEEQIRNFSILNGKIEFEATGFSTYVLYTVDFFYGAYDFHLNGNGEILLSDLLTALQIEADLTGSNATFTAPNLLELKPQFFKNGGVAVRKDTVLDDAGDAKIPLDWLIRSLAPFDTEETLTVTLQNGDQISLTVTDKQIIKYHQTEEGDTYKITVKYDEDAGIPDDAVLTIAEVNPDLYIADAATVLGAKDASYLLYTKFLNISFITTDEEGHQEEVEPVEPVAVTIELMDVTDGAEALQVIHFDENETEIISSTVTENAVVNFETDAFSVFGIGNALKTIATTETAEVNIEILGFSGGTEIVTVDAPAVEEGLEVLGAYSLSESDNKLWIKSDMKDGVELSAMESVMIYGVKEEEQSSEADEDQTGEQDKEQNNTTQLSELVAVGTVAELNVSEFALVKDSGYRHLSFEIYVGGEEIQAVEEGTEAQEESSEMNGKIILDGMMPKMAIAEAVDVTDAYVDHEYAVPEERVDEEASEVPVNDEVGEDAEEYVEVDARADEEMQNSAEEEQTRTTLAAFDITISNDESEYQPDEDHPISVEIHDSRIYAEQNIELWHIKDDGTEERVSEFTVEEGRVEFTAVGFSVYTIIEAGDPYVPLKAGTVQDLKELAENYSDSDGFYLSYNDDNPMYVTNWLNEKSAFIETGNETEASRWYFDVVPDQTDQYYIYTKINGVDQFMSNSSGNLMGLTEDRNDAISFYFSCASGTTAPFLIKKSNEKKWLQHSNGGGGVRFWTDANDKRNPRFTITYASSISAPDDYYGLNGKTYSIVYHEESVKAAALTSNAITMNGKQCLDYQELLVRPDVIYTSGELLIAQDVDLREWTFENISGTEYYISTMIGGTTYYIKLDKENLSLTSIKTDATPITVTAGTGENSGKYSFSASGYSITHIGSTNGAGNTGNEWFKGSNNGGDKSWLSLASRSSILTDEDFTVYSAEKVDLSDRTVVPGYAVNPGDPEATTVVIYTRKWNDTTKKYEFYALNADGSLIRCFESGDMIQWVGSTINTALWDFTEYHYEGTTDPNYYYELQNSYSGKYLAPQVTGGQILADSKIGINMNGRRYGYYYSTILAWDNEHYSYVGLRMKDDKTGIESCDMNEADHFYFAIMKPVSTTEELHEVATVDNYEHGITMKLVDLEQKFMNEILVGVAGNPNKGLLSTDLKENGYPIALENSSGQSLADMYAGAQPVNHLFIENTYYSSGYYEYDSTQNFASLKGNKTGNFTVYQELGTWDGDDKTTLKHGQFFPYNDIEAGVYVTKNNPLNLYTSSAIIGNNVAGLLPDSNPRKGEKLHLVAEPDYFYAMELSASFTQTVSGKDAWGHDIIYEFTGDDDFWLYVDGELVIDLGGTHSALAGSVNYRTGEVKVDGFNATTLRDTFYNNYRGRGHTEEEAKAYVDEIFDENGIFKDYTKHTMKIFYMERGAGAANLHMRFNLASVKPGTVELSKVISGVDSTESFMADYPFQIFFKKEGDSTEQPLIPSNSDGISVKYKDSTRDVPYSPEFTASDGMTKYNHVYLLKPGEVAVIDFPDNTYSYNIVECFVNTDIYEKVSVNDMDITNAEDFYSQVLTNRKNFYSGYEEVSKREKVTFDNHVKEGAKGVLTFKKILYAEDGTTLITNDSNAFTFRLYLGTENDSILPLANMHSYHVKDANGYYCKWVSGTGFVSLGKKIFDDGNEAQAADELTPAERLQATFNTSMNGAIDKIPAGYTVEVREIPLGTKYRVEERYRELPDGYSLKRYTLNEKETDHSGKTPAEGYIDAEANNNVVVENMKGWGIRATKVWSDDEWMADRDPAYFALYINRGGTLSIVDGTVTQLLFGEESVYWFIAKLENGISFADYIPREVTINNTNPTVDAETGIVSNPGEVTPLNVNDTFTINGRQIGERTEASYTYAVISYEIGAVTTGANIRRDTITNKRAGIELYKMKWDGIQPLEGAVFTLTYDDKGTPTDAGAAIYTSDRNGYITTAYLRENVVYTLTEVSSPAGYQGLQTALKIRRSGNDVYVTNAAEAGWSVETDSDDPNTKYGEQGANIWWKFDDTDETRNTGGTDFEIRIGRLEIRNKPYTLRFVKTAPSNDNPEEYAPLSGVTFALYPQAINSSGDPRRDYIPVDGFNELITDEDGLVPLITDAFKDGRLLPGTYYLYEVSTLPQYRPLSEDVKFTVSETGKISLDSYPSGVTLEPTNDDDTITNTIIIPNALAGTVQWLYVNKIVEDVTWNDPHVFTFTAKLYLPDGMTPWNYSNTNSHDENQVPFKNGVASFSLTDYKETKGNMVLLEVPQGAVVKVTEDATIAYDTTAEINEYKANERSDSIETFEYNPNNRTSSLTINDGIAVLLTYRNTRKYVNVTVRKDIQDDPGRKGTFSFIGTLMDYYENESIDITEHIDELSSFTITIDNKTWETRVFRIPVRTTLTITEQQTPDQQLMYNVPTYNPSSGTMNVISASTFNIYNRRKTQTVTITKELEDSLVTGAVSVPFSVTLYQEDGLTPITSYQMYSLDGTTIKTGDGKNGTILGVASFNLSVTSGSEGTASQSLKVPYGAVLQIVEDDVTGGHTYNTTITEPKGTSKIDTSDKKATVTVTDDATIYYKNTLIHGDASLTISKTVEDLATGSIDGAFTFEISNLDASAEYNYTPQIKDGAEWVAYTDTTWEDGTAKSKQTDDSGKLTFILHHNTRVIVEIPVGKTVTITETNSGGFTPSYRVTHGTGTTGNSISGNRCEVLLNGNKTIDFINTKGVVAPTGFNFRHTPWLLLLLFGWILLIGSGMIAKRRRRDEPDDVGIVAQNNSHLNTGPSRNTSPVAKTRELADLCFDDRKGQDVDIVGELDEREENVSLVYRCPGSIAAAECDG